MSNENLPEYRLISAASIFILIIIIGFISLRQPEYTYQKSPQQTLDVMLNEENTITPEAVDEIIMFGDSGYRFVDLRSPYAFVKGHLEGAINIPFESLLEKENLAYFETDKDSILTIIYGSDELQANGPYVMLRQLGYSNIKVMRGGYDYYSTNSLSYYDMPDQPEYLVEQARYNFAEIVQNTAGLEVTQDVDAQPESIIPVRKKKKRTVEGGC